MAARGPRVKIRSLIPQIMCVIHIYVCRVLKPFGLAASYESKPYSTHYISTTYRMADGESEDNIPN